VHGQELLRRQGRAVLRAREKSRADAGKPVLTGDAAKKAACRTVMTASAPNSCGSTRAATDAEFSEPEPAKARMKATMRSTREQAWDERFEDWQAPTFRELLEGALADRVTLAKKAKASSSSSCRRRKRPNC
jgi:hypothetical protein